jgi:hypothetical protein
MQKKLKIGVAGNNDEIKSAYLGHFGNYFETTNYISFVSLLASLEKQDIDIGFIDQESVKNIEKHSDIKVNFEILANVPIFKTSDQKNYNIIKLKNTN